jgi:hypothetical protein
MRRTPHISTFKLWTEQLMAWLDRRPADMQVGITALNMLKIQDDPEAIFQEGWLLCDAGEHEQGLAYLRLAVGRGYFVAETLWRSPAFDALRGRRDFQALLSEADAGRQLALAAFREAGGDRLLGS